MQINKLLTKNLKHFFMTLKLCYDVELADEFVI